MVQAGRQAKICKTSPTGSELHEQRKGLSSVVGCWAFFRSQPKRKAILLVSPITKAYVAWMQCIGANGVSCIGAVQTLPEPSLHCSKNSVVTKPSWMDVAHHITLSLLLTMTPSLIYSVPALNEQMIKRAIRRGLHSHELYYKNHDEGRPVPVPVCFAFLTYFSLSSSSFSFKSIKEREALVR